MGTVGDALDNAVAESFSVSLQTELLDRSVWATRAELDRAVFAYIEGFYNPRRRHSALDYLSPADYESTHSRPKPLRRHDPYHSPKPSGEPGALQCPPRKVRTSRRP